MAKGVVPFSHSLWLGAVGMQARRLRGLRLRPGRRDHLRRLRHGRVSRPTAGIPDKDRQIVHIDDAPAEVDEHYIAGVRGGGRHRRRPWTRLPNWPGRSSIFRPPGCGRRSWTSCREYADDAVFPMKPQRIVWDLQRAFWRPRAPWSATWAHTRSGWPGCTSPSGPTRASSPTVLRPWGSPCPAPSPPSWPFPIAPAVAVTGDGGFMMNSQEIETALRIGTPIVIVIWNDCGYGLIEWHQLPRFRPPGVCPLPAIPIS